jgi:site-specific DNA recombinase
VTAVYSDRDTSAYNGAKRPEYQRLMADLQARKIDAVLVWKLDRLTRRVVEIGKVMGVLEQTGAVLASVHDQIDTSTAMGKGVLSLMASLAESESESTSKRVRRAARQSAERGDFPKTGSRCFGYTDEGTVIESEAVQLRKMAKMFVNGTTYRKIAAQMNSDGLLTTRGNAWSGRSVAQLLASPRIAGYRDYAGEMIRGRWERILDANTWAAVRQAAAGARRPAERQTDIRHPFTGIVRCGVCGGRMGVMKWRQPRTGTVFPRYSCVRNPGTVNCGHVAASKGPVDKIIRWEMTQAVLAHHFPGADAVANAETELIEIEKALEEAAHARFVERSLSHEHYLSAKAIHDDRKAVVTGELKSARTSRPNVASMTIGELSAWWDSAPIDEQRALVRSVIDEGRVKVVTR